MKSKAWIYASKSAHHTAQNVNAGVRIRHKIEVRVGESLEVPRMCKKWGSTKL